MTATLADPWAVAADEVLPAEAPRDVWLAERRKGLGGSDTSVVFGLNRYQSPIGLWLEKTGRAEPEPEEDDYTLDPDSNHDGSGHYREWGNRLEGVAADWFADHYRTELRRCGLLRHRDYPCLQATPDRLTPDSGVEIKSLEWHTEHEWDDGQIPDHAELQAQKCMLLTGRRRWYVIGLVNGRRPRVRVCERDDAVIAEIVRYETWWWNSYVIADEMPPLDASQATLDAVQSLYPVGDPEKVLQINPELLGLYRELEEAKRARDAAAAEMVGIESKIRMAIGDASVVVIDPEKPHDDTAAGKRNVLATVANNGTFASKRFVAAHPDLAAALQIDVPGLDMERLKKEHADVYARYRARVVRTRKALTELLAAPAPSATTGGI